MAYLEHLLCTELDRSLSVTLALGSEEVARDCEEGLRELLH